MDAITLLKDDHKTVERLFRRFEKAGDDAYREKRDIADRIVEELSIHAAIEEQIFYPVTRMTVTDVEDVVLESLEEHHIVKWVLSEISSMDPQDERFDAKVTVLIENVRHHVEEEESEFFPKVREELGRKSLNDLGEALEQAKKTAPTRPHPHSPDSPPGNIIVGTAAGMVDKVSDTVSGLAQGGVNVVQELVGTILGQKPAPRSATGSSTTRRTAARVESGAEEVQKRAASGTRRAARAVSRGGTARTTTRRSAAAAKKKASTAGRSATRTAKSTAKTTAKKASRPVNKASRPAKKAARAVKNSSRPAKKTTRSAKRTSSR